MQTPTSSSLCVGIDVREWCERPAGKGQYLWQIVQQWMLQAPFPMVWYVRYGQALPAEMQAEANGRPDQIRVVAVSGRGPLWHRAVARRLRRDGVTVFYACLSYQSALWNPVPTVTVVHDLAVFLPQLVHNRRAQLVEKNTLKLTARRSARLIVVSKATERDLMEKTAVSPEKVALVYGAAFSSPTTSPKLFAERAKFFLYMGTLEPRKNIPTILQVYAALPAEIRKHYRLKLAGKTGWGGENYPQLAKDLGIAESVDFLGYVSTEERETLLATAAIFFFPSLYEGFGLPVVEALAVGTPVITSNVSSLPEVIGSVLPTFAPEDWSGMVQEVKKLLSDSSYYDAVVRAAVAQAGTFRWDKSARSTAEVIKNAEKSQ